MPKKKFDLEENIEEAQPAPQIVAEVNPEKHFTAPTTAAVRYFEIVKWRGIKDVFRCMTCGTNRDDFDAMVEHILLHHKGHEEEVFEILMKEKQQ